MKSGIDSAAPPKFARCVAFIVNWFKCEGRNAGEYHKKGREQKTVADKARADRTCVDTETIDRDWRNEKKSNRQVEKIHLANRKEGEEQK